MRIDIERILRDIEAIAAFTSTPGAGTTRLSFSEEYRKACDYVAEAAREFGMTARYDAVGNLRVLLPGRSPEKPAVLVASHLDSVRNGGDFDGVLGVVCGLEAARVIVESGQRPERSIALISFVEEEGTSFRCPLAGSKALTGFVDLNGLEKIRNDEGKSFLSAARDFGVQPERLPEDMLRAGGIHMAFELHIEQGRVLESEGFAVGVAEGIAGSDNYRVRLSGEANHAGTTPMHLRRDALAGAAEVVLAVERIATGRRHPNTVATVGRISCQPNSANVVPGLVEFSVDVRDVDGPAIEAASTAIADAVSAIADSRGLLGEIQLTGRSQPTRLSAQATARLEAIAAERGERLRRMHSGALHDAAMMSRVADVGLIFVPSRDGRSHCPEEFTDPGSIEAGAGLLAEAVRAYAAS